METVITYGTFDYFHYGHYNYLKQAKALGDYLIVGVSTDALCEKKGKKPILSQQERYNIIASLKFVDKVIFENSFEQKIDDVDRYGVTIYADGEDYKDLFPKSEVYKILKNKCKIIFLKRTFGVSTTQLKENLKIQMGLDKNQESLRNKTNVIRQEKEK